MMMLLRMMMVIKVHLLLVQGSNKAIPWSGKAQGKADRAGKESPSRNRRNCKSLHSEYKAHRPRKRSLSSELREPPVIFNHSTMSSGNHATAVFKCLPSRGM